jgi:hypothetical protein
MAWVIEYDANTGLKAWIAPRGVPMQTTFRIDHAMVFVAEEDALDEMLRLGLSARWQLKELKP